MDLELSTWTRRERLERIAAAERDRRAGRDELALAAIGEAAEWPARIVLALIRLPGGEGDAARAILEETLDAWMADAGLVTLEAEGTEETDEAAAPGDSVEADDGEDASVAPDTDASDEVESVVSFETHTPEAAGANGSFAAPIAIDELDRAFAEAEAQTDEMLDVNTVAARVLMDEPVGLAEIGDPGPSEPSPGEPIAADGAWVASRIWSNGVDVTPDDGVIGLAEVTASPVTTQTEPEVVLEDGDPHSRTHVLATLEGWLANIERGRTTRGPASMGETG